MQETPQSSVFKRKETLALLGLLLVVVVSFAIALRQTASHVDELESKVGKLEKSNTASTESAQEAANPLTLESGKGGFTMTVPAGWGPLIKDTESDFFLIGGMAQPTMKAGAKTEVRELKGFGSDSASLFVATLSKDGLGDMVQGTGEEFTIGKGDDALVGKKYSYVYPKDDIEGIGYARYQNDRQYRYIFTAKDGKKLDIVYNVYGSDPRNLSANVDAIVQSIVIK